MNEVVVVGTSSGGLEALRTLASGLPRDFPSPICVVIHTSADSPGFVHEIVGRVTALATVLVRESCRAEPGTIYFAPPDHHLLIGPDGMRVTKGPKENRFRPAIDPLFRTASEVCGPGAIGVILTGNLDDGTAGLAAIKARGGTAVVQDPRDALFPAMPQNALSQVQVDYCVPLAKIAPLLIELTRRTRTTPALPAYDDTTHNPSTPTAPVI